MQQWAFEHISSAQADDNNIQMMLLRHLLEYQQWVHKGKEFIYFKNRIDVNIKLKPQMIAWYQEQLQHPGSSRLIGSIQPNFQWIKWTNVKYVNNPSVRLIIMTNCLLNYKTYIHRIKCASTSLAHGQSQLQRTERQSTYSHLPWSLHHGFSLLYFPTMRVKQLYWHLTRNSYANSLSQTMYSRQWKGIFRFGISRNALILWNLSHRKQ